MKHYLQREIYVGKDSKFMQESGNFDEKWPRKEQTQDFKYQVP